MSLSLRTWFVILPLVFLAGPGLHAEPDEVRSWTNSKGEVILARCLEIVDGQKVRLEVKDGRTYEYPIHLLSVDDQIFLQWCIADQLGQLKVVSGLPAPSDIRR